MNALPPDGRVKRYYTLTVASVVLPSVKRAMRHRQRRKATKLNNPNWNRYNQSPLLFQKNRVYKDAMLLQVFERVNFDGPKRMTDRDCVRRKQSASEITPGLIHV